MPITVVGSVAYDSVETPSGRYERKLAGAATYFSLAAASSPPSASSPSSAKTSAPSRKPSSTPEASTSRASSTPPAKASSGKALTRHLNEAKTHNTELNVFATFEPKIPAAYADSTSSSSPHRSHPSAPRPRAMPDVQTRCWRHHDYWIKDHRPALLEVLKGLDILLINDTEARMIAGNPNLLQAARGVHGLGPNPSSSSTANTARHCSISPTQKPASASTTRSALLQCSSKKSSTHRRRRQALPEASSASSPLSHDHPRRLSPRHVLWQRHGLLCLRALRH